MMEINVRDFKAKGEDEDVLLIDDANQEEDIKLINEEENKELGERCCSRFNQVREKAISEFIDRVTQSEDPSELINKYKNSFAKMCEDSHPLNLELALDLQILIFQKYSHTIEDEISNEILKCTIEKSFACSKTPVKNKTKLLIELILENSDNITAHYSVINNLIQFSPKKVKSIMLAEKILLFLISEYGCKNFDYQFFMPNIVKLIEGSNHGVRSEAYEIIKEIYRWIRADTLQYLKGIKANYMKELNNAFEKIQENEPSLPLANRNLENSKNERVIQHNELKAIIPTKTTNSSEYYPTNFIQNEKEKSSLNSSNKLKEEYFTTPTAQIKNDILNEKKNIFLSDIYSEVWVNNLLAKERKWLEKKEMLEEFTRVVSSCKLLDTVDASNENLFSSFKILLKDSNINVVQSTITAINSLSLQLGNSFAIYTREYFPLILEKFKEKKDKLNKEIITTLTTFLRCNMTLDELIPVLVNVPLDKSNQFKLNICEFLLISMMKTYKNILRKVVRELVDIFVKLYDEQNIEIRNTALNCLALLKVRLSDVFQKEGILKDMNENKRLKVEECAKTITYDKLYDVEPIMEKSEIPAIKINRKKAISTIDCNKNEISTNLLKKNEVELNTEMNINHELAHSKIESLPQITNESPPKTNDVHIFGTEDIPYSKDKQQSNLDEFTRMLEEAMKKEGENKIDPTSNISITKPVVKKQAISKKLDNNGGNMINEDEDDGKLNKAEIEDKINSLIGDEAAALLQSLKWDEKKTGLIMLNDWLNDNIVNNNLLISNNIENIIVFLKIKLKDYKESNFNIIREACTVYTSLISNFTGKGFDKKFSVAIIKGLYEKFAEPKLKEHISNLLFTMMENHGPKFVMNSLLKNINNEKKQSSNNVLKEYSILFEKAAEDFGINYVPVKEMVDYCKVMAANVNPQVRNASTSLLCVLYKYVGKDIKILLKDIKESTLKVIETELDKVTIVDPKIPHEPKRKLKNSALEGMILPKGDNVSGKSVPTNNSINLVDSLIPRVDISKKITPKLLKDISDGKWPEKKEACESLEKILNDANMKIQPNGLNDLFNCIKGRLSDGNKNVVRLIVNLLSKLLDAIGSGFKIYTKLISGPLINNLSDKMQMLREDVLMCMDKWVSQNGIETIIAYIPNYLKQDNFEMRTEIFKFLHKQKECFVFIKDKYDLKEFVTPLLFCLQDKSVSIRNSAEDFIAYSLRFIPLNLYYNGLKDFKTAIVNTLKQILDKYKGVEEENIFEIGPIGASNSTTLILKQDKSGDIRKSNLNMDKSYLPNKKKEEGIHKANSQEKIKSYLKTNDEETINASKKNSNINVNKIVKKNKNQSENNLVSSIRNTKSKVSSDDLSTDSTTIKMNSKVLNINNNLHGTTLNNKKVTSTLSSIFLQNPNLKQTKDKRLEIDKKYKFNLETLNDDFALKLKEYFKLLFTPEFMNKLFHDELKYNIEALNMIHMYFRDNIKLNFSVYDYLDVILKWVGWKWNNNQNPLLVKVLMEYLETLWEKIEEKDYELNDTEGYIILALLIDKLGNNNSKLKDTARSLIEKYTSKVPNTFSNLIYSSASKVSKIKVECIELCTNLIANSGVDIFPQKDFKYLAKLISTNDNSIKASIFNLFAEVYIQMKESLWNKLNDIPDKLKEQLYNKFCSMGIVEEVNKNLDYRQTENRADEVNSNYNTYQENLNTEIDKINQKHNKEITFPLIQNNLNLNANNNNEFINIRNKRKSSLISDTLEAQITHNKNSILENDNMNSNCSSYSNFSIVNNRSDLIDVLNNLNNPDISERVNVILIIHELVYTKYNQSKQVLIPNIDIIIKSFVNSLRNLFENKITEEIPVKLGKYLLTVLYKISSNKELIKNLSYEILFELSEEVLSNLLIDNLEKLGENQEGIIIIRSLNSTMLRVLENCNYTNVITVLLELVKKYRIYEDNKIKISGLAIKCLLKINQV